MRREKGNDERTLGFPHPETESRMAFLERQIQVKRRCIGDDKWSDGNECNGRERASETTVLWNTFGK